MYKLLLIAMGLIVGYTATPRAADMQLAAQFAGLLRGGPGPVGVPIIVDIQPHSAAVDVSVASVGTTVTTYTCIMNDRSTCPPPGSGYVWSMASQPSFLTLNQTTGVLSTNRALTSSDSCTPTQDSCTFPVTIGPPSTAATVIGIAPTSLPISDQAVQGTVFQFYCTMSDNSACTNRTWSYASIPSFLTPTINSTGVVLTTNLPPPLNDSSGTLTVSAQ